MVAFDKPTRAIVKQADAVAGQQLTEAEKCSKCHGDAGISEDPADPNIAGQLMTYAFKQMIDYRDEHRDSRSMKKAMRKLSDQDIANLAAYYASLPPAPPVGTIDDEVFQLVYKGDPKRDLKPCASCHGFKGEGGKWDSATLIGQDYDYFVETMIAFQDEDRENDIYSRMRNLAKELTEEEIEKLAAYYSGAPKE